MYLIKSTVPLQVVGYMYMHAHVNVHACTCKCTCMYVRNYALLPVMVMCVLVLKLD